MRTLTPSKPSLFHEPQLKRTPSSAPKKRVIVISGPTATGKTNLSISLAQAVGGEIISADSCQVYRGMDIGTAKATIEQRSLITHHLIDVRDIKEPYNVAEFYKEAEEIIEEIFKRDNVPIIVGGSGFYVHTLIYGPPHGPASIKEVRKELEKQMETFGPEVLYERLQLLDPEYAKTISEQDRHKIIRALEIMTISEQRVSDFPLPKETPEHKYDFRCWFLHFAKEKLYERIEARCEEMLSSGFLDEVKHLIKTGLKENPSACNAIGYRQALKYLDSAKTALDLQTFISEFKRATKQFAKRQFTWFRKEPLFRWLQMDDYPIERLKEIILQDFEQGHPLF